MRRLLVVSIPLLLTGFWLALLLAGGAGSTPAVTQFVGFDSYVNGTTPGALPEGVTFLDGPVVFTPSSTASPPRALQSGVDCNTNCTNNAYRLRMSFPTPVTRVALSTGLNSAPSEFGTYARLVGYRSDGSFLVAGPDTSVGSPITTSLEITDPAGQIASATLFVGKGTSSKDTGPRRAMLDSLRFDVPSAPPATTTAPTTTTTPPATTTAPPPPPALLPPAVTITSPVAGQMFERSDLVRVSGTITARSGINQFCVVADNASSLPADCTQAAYATGSGPVFTFTNVAVLGPAMTPGRHTLTAWVQDRRAQVAHASVVIFIASVATGIDLRAITLEVTQGIQGFIPPPSVGGLPPADGRVYLTPGIATGHPGGTYNGVKLVEGKKTAVRLYATADSTGTVGHAIRGVKALLHGFRRSGSRLVPLPGSPLLPDLGPRDLGRDAWPAMRLQDRGAYTFTLPPFWTAVTIELVGEVNPPSLVPAISECLGCLTDNAFTVTRIAFTDTRILEIHPVHMPYVRADGGGARVPDPVAPFQRIRELGPWPDHELQVGPYLSTLDVTRIAICNRRDREADYCTGNRTQDLADRCEDWNDDHGRRGKVICIQRGLTAGITRGDEPAVVEVQRPLTSVAHELFHMLDLEHASRGCGGGSNGQVGVSWPPDQMGFIQGVGLDLRAYSGGRDGPYKVIAAGLPGQPAQWFDFMSYCVTDLSPAETDSWISVRNWNKTVNGLRRGGGLRDLSARRAVGPTLRIAAVVDAKDGSVRIRRIQRGSGTVTPPSPNSAYHFVLRNAAGSVISDTGVEPSVIHTHEQLDLYLSAEVPAPPSGLASIEVVKDKAVHASRKRSANAPSVRIITPKAGARIGSGGSVSIRWVASDRDGDPLQIKVEYSTDDGATWRTLTLGASGSTVSLPAALFSASSRARVRVSANDGFDETTAVSGRFGAVGSQPVVRVLSPARKGERVAADAALYLAGEAYDDTGAPLRGKQLRWLFAEKLPLKLLGTGNAISVTGLPPGLRTIRLIATDSHGRSATAFAVVRVLGTAPAFLKLQAPRRLGRNAQVLILKVAATVPATLSVGGKRVAVDRRTTVVRVPVVRGGTPLRLVLRLTAGGKTTRVVLTIQRA